MKKLLALLLAMLLCFGVLVSCSPGEKAPSAKDLSFYNSITPAKERYKTYYNTLEGDIMYIPSSNIFEDEELDGTIVSEWYIVDDYEEYKNIIFDNGKLDSTDFEENIVAIRWGYFPEAEYYNFRIEDNVVHIDCDSFSRDADTYQPAFSPCLDVIIIPRAEVTTTNFYVREVVLNQTGVFLSQSWWYEMEKLDYNDGDTWLIDEQKDWDEFKPFFKGEESPNLGFEDDLYIVVYREKSSAYTYAYCFPKISNDGKEVTIECRETQSLYDTQNGAITEGFELIRVTRHRLYENEISQDAKVKIAIKTLDFK